MLGVVRVPYMDTQVDRLMRDVAGEMGRGKTYNRAPVGVYFGTPGVEADDPYFGGEGPRRRGCISCGNCMIGCGHNAKNKLTVNYLYLAEKYGAEIHELQEVYEVKPLDGGGFEVHARHPGWLQRAAHLDHHRYTAAQVIVSAHAYGSAKLLHHLKHTGTLRACRTSLASGPAPTPSSSSSITRPYSEWRRDPDRIHVTPGSVCDHIGRVARRSNEHRTGPLRRWQRPDGVRSHVPSARCAETPGRGLAEGADRTADQVLDNIDARHWSERQVIMLCMQTTDTSIDLYWKDDMLRSRHGSGQAPSAHIPVVEDFADRLAKKMHGEQGACGSRCVNRTASAHFIGGIPIGESADHGVVDPYQRAFGYPGLHVMDGSVMPANPGVNPSLMITGAGGAGDVAVAEQGRRRLRGHRSALAITG